MNRASWDDYLMSIACVVSMRSHDPDTRHGSVIADADHRILGVGYNGFPRGGADIYPKTRPEKYDFVIHSEVNAIFNCSVSDHLKGAEIYVTGMPCPRCMVSIVQVGIKKVIYGQINSAMVGSEVAKNTKLIAHNHKIELQEYTGNPFGFFENTMEYLKSKGWDHANQEEGS